jgi:prevent-host-death family protein
MPTLTHAKTHLSALIRRAEAGERITLTGHGQPVAVLGPVSATLPLIGALEGRVHMAEDFDHISKGCAVTAPCRRHPAPGPLRPSGRAP